MRKKFVLMMVPSLIVLTNLAAASPDPHAAAESKGVPAPLVYGLIIDNTASVVSNLEPLIAGGRALIENNSPADKTFIVTYSNRDNVTLQNGFTSSKEKLLDTLDNMYAQGGPAALLYAVYLAADLLAKDEESDEVPQGNHALVLLTTGVNEDSFYRLGQVLAMLHEKHIPVYVISFSKVLKLPGGKAEAAAAELCQQLAVDGQAYFPSSETEVMQAARNIVRQMRLQKLDAKK